MAEQFNGFRFAYRESQAPIHPKKLISADAALAKGDMVNLETGKVDLGVTNDGAFLGMVLETKSGMNTTSDTIEVITHNDAVYAVYDANARAIGDLLDLTGATGAQGVGTSTNADFVVVADSAADELTYVKLNPATAWPGG
jgi:hypothetical protein